MTDQDIKPFNYGYRYHDCIRFNGGESVNGERPSAAFPVYDQATVDRIVATKRESTRFVDNAGREIFLGDVVRAEVKAPFSIRHGAWSEYEVTKAAGGYVLSYVRSEKGCLLPFGYTACFMNQYEIAALPDSQNAAVRPRMRAETRRMRETARAVSAKKFPDHL